MAPIIVLEHAFSFPRSTGSISRKTINLLQKLSFNEEGKIYASHHLSEFNLICNHLHIFDESEICRLFIVTLRGRIQSWFEMFPAKSIHTWKQFMELFLNTHEDYNYKELWLEVENIRRHEGELVDDLFSRFMLICFRFHEKDQPSGEDALDWFLYLNYLSNTQGSRE
jgi:hypothetical protein